MSDSTAVFSPVADTHNRSNHMTTESGSRPSEDGLRSEKLVRDCYAWLPHRIAGHGEKYGLLAAKLDEEVAEVKAAAIGSPEFVEELADLVEVCYALGGENAVEQARQAKSAERGGFDRLLVMKLSDITDKPASPVVSPEQQEGP